MTPRERPIKTRPHAKTLSLSNIPTLKRPGTAGSMIPGGLLESALSRPMSSHSKIATPGSPGKLRLQSPQKLRERLQTEKQAVDDVDISLRSELSRITEDMARVNGNPGGGSGSLGPRVNTLELRKLSASVRALEDRVPAAIAELSDRQAVMHRDMETALRASEAKVKAVDQLYKEAVAENELLYERFGGELAKILRGVKGKGKEDREELLVKVKEMNEEATRVKKENGRLRREIAGLRAAMKALSEKE
jgi:hypothetical protein